MSALDAPRIRATPTATTIPADAIGTIKPPARHCVLPLATVQHARVADDVTRRLVLVGADQSQALKTPFDVQVSVLERAEHRLVQG
jgi:hypothetical protein